MLFNVLIASWRALRLSGFWSGTSDSCSWGAWSIGGENGRKREKTVFVFRFDAVFFWGLIGLDPIFFVGRDDMDVCIYVIMYFFLVQRWTSHIPKWQIPLDETKKISLRSGTGTQENPELGLLKRPKTTFFLGDSKLSCVIFVLYVRGFKTTWFWVVFRDMKGRHYPPC